MWYACASTSFVPRPSPHMTVTTGGTEKAWRILPLLLQVGWRKPGGFHHCYYRWDGESLEDSTTATTDGVKKARRVPPLLPRVGWRKPGGFHHCYHRWGGESPGGFYHCHHRWGGESLEDSTTATTGGVEKAWRIPPLLPQVGRRKPGGFHHCYHRWGGESPEGSTTATTGGVESWNGP